MEPFKSGLFIKKKFIFFVGAKICLKQVMNTLALKLDKIETLGAHFFQALERRAFVELQVNIC